jgi:hypothetical protein
MTRRAACGVRRTALKDRTASGRVADPGRIGYGNCSLPNTARRTPHAALTIYIGKYQEHA